MVLCKTKRLITLKLGLKFLLLYDICIRRNKAFIKELSKPALGSKELYFPTQYSQSFFTQSMACLWKQYWSYWHNPPYTAVRFLFTTFMALAFGTMFWDLGLKTLVTTIELRKTVVNAYGLLLHFNLPLNFKPHYCSGKQQDLFHAMGSMFSAVLSIGSQNASSVQPVVDVERTVFYRERAAGMYSSLPYALAQVSRVTSHNWFKRYLVHRVYL